MSHSQGSLPWATVPSLHSWVLEGGGHRTRPPACSRFGGATLGEKLGWGETSVTSWGPWDATSVWVERLGEPRVFSVCFSMEVSQVPNYSVLFLTKPSCVKELRQSPSHLTRPLASVPGHIWSVPTVPVQRGPRWWVECPGRRWAMAVLGGEELWLGHGSGRVQIIPVGQLQHRSLSATWRTQGLGGSWPEALHVQAEPCQEPEFPCTPLHLIQPKSGNWTAASRGPGITSSFLGEGSSVLRMCLCVCGCFWSCCSPQVLRSLCHSAEN